jgi:hypothetical protein
MTEPRQIAVVRSYAQLVDTLRARAFELGATYAAIDEVAGLPTRYTSKALALGPVERLKGTPLGIQSLWPMLEALGMEVVVRERPDALERYKNRVGGGKTSYMLNGVKNAPVILKISRRHMHELGKKSGATRAQTIPKRTRSRIARQAAKARWRKPRVTQLADAAAMLIAVKHQAQKQHDVLQKAAPNEGALPPTEIHVNARGASHEKALHLQPSAAKRGPARRR